MKKILGFLVLSLALFHNTAQAEKAEGVEITKTAQAINFTQSIDMSKWDRASVQAVYADGTPAAHTVQSGAKRIATIGVVNNSSDLIANKSSDTVSIRSITLALGDTVTFNGIEFKEGREWSMGASTTTSAANLAARIDAHPDFEATSVGSTVTVRYAIYGTAGNGLSVTTTDSTNLAIGNATMINGINQHTVTINGIVLTIPTSFAADASSRTTAGNLTIAINANATLAAQVIASTSVVQSSVTITALYPGTNASYYAQSSTSGFTIQNFSAGLDSDIDIQTDVFTKVAHGLTTGLKVAITTAAAGVPPGGLTHNSTYYAIKLNENQYALATTSVTAVAGTKIDITSLPSTQTTYTMNVPALAAGSAGFFWQASNDNTNFTNLSAVTYSSVTYSAAGNSLWDFAEFGYKYLRMSFTGPTSGGIAITAKVYGKKD